MAWALGLADRQIRHLWTVPREEVAGWKNRSCLARA